MISLYRFTINNNKKSIIKAKIRCEYKYNNQNRILINF